MEEIKQMLEYCTKEELEQLKDIIFYMLENIKVRDELRKKLWG